VALANKPKILNSFGISCFRILKLFRWGEVHRYFTLFDLRSRKKGALSFNRALFIVYYFNAFLHFFTCVWLITGRVDMTKHGGHEEGWFKKANFDMNPTYLEMYIESLFFVITDFAGAGYGNIELSTNLEFFIDTFLNLIGSSLFICIFVDFVMEYSMRNLPVYTNAKLLDETLLFAEITSLPESLVFKIRYYYDDLNLKF